MARPIEYIIELDAEQAQRVLEDLINPKPNAARAHYLRRVLGMKFDIR